MTEQEFINKFSLKFRNAAEEALFFGVLDDLYVQFTKEQVLEMVGTYYDNADDIFNDRQSRLEEGIKNLKELMNEVIDKLQ